jgi:hypothetical protein
MVFLDPAMAVQDRKKAVRDPGTVAGRKMVSLRRWTVSREVKEGHHLAAFGHCWKALAALVIVYFEIFPLGRSMSFFAASFLSAMRILNK